MTVLLVLLMLLVVSVGTAVVLTRDPKEQVFVYGLYSSVLALLFAVLQAPDVALSEIAVGSVAVPAAILVTIAKTQKRGR